MNKTFVQQRRKRNDLGFLYQLAAFFAAAVAFCALNFLLFNGSADETGKIFACFALLLLVYLLLGATLPLVKHKKITVEEVKNFDGSQVYGNGCCGERVLSIEGNLEPLLWRLRLFDRAEKNIVYSTMDFRNDNSGVDILAALLAAAERGVKVRLLVDGLRCMYFLRSKEVKALIANENAEVRAYNPFDLWRPWRCQARLHDKYIIIDDEIYTLGGRNTNDLFLGNYGGRQNIDRELLVWNPQKKGGSLRDVKGYFEKMWSSEFCVSQIVKKSYAGSQEDLRLRYEKLREIYTEAFQFYDLNELTYAAQKVTFLSNQQVPYNKEPVLWHCLNRVMAEGEDVLIQTPYLILSREMHDDLFRLASDRKRRVRVITNAVETGANIWGCSDYLNNKKRLLQTGIDIFECVSRDSCHLKCIMVDNSLSLVGSFNFDMRSCYLDTELMLAVDCSELNRELREYAGSGIDKSRHITADGLIGKGCRYEDIPLPKIKSALYAVLRYIIRPIRFLL